MQDARFALEDYMHFLKVERQLAVNTITSYSRDLDDYIGFMEQAEHETIDLITRRDILTYLQSMNDERIVGTVGFKTYFINSFISSISSS